MNLFSGHHIVSRLLPVLSRTYTLSTILQFDLLQTAKRMYLETKTMEVNSIATVKLTEVEYEYGYPTEKGTADIISQVNGTFGNEIILPDAEEDITTPRKYSQVKAIYKTGCRGCSTEEFTSHLCTQCMDLAQGVDASDLRRLIDEIHEKMFPATIGIDENDVEMQTINDKKRELSPASDDEENKSKSHRTDTQK